jgi:hypothetical protein
MDLRRAETQEPLNMTWAGKESEQPRSLQSPETYLLLTFPFIERGYRRSEFCLNLLSGPGRLDHFCGDVVPYRA